MIKNIVFDFGGVLVDWNPRYLYDGYFGDEDKSRRFIGNICTGEWNVQMDAGRPFAECVAELSAKYPEWAEAIEIYHSRWTEMIGGQVEGTAAVVRRLKDAGYGVYGLTNWSNETFPLVRDRYEVFSWLDGIVVSGDERMVKPDARIYRCLLDRYGLDPAESVFIDDNETNVAAARAVGMEGLRFESAAQLERDLKSLYGLNI